MKKRLIERRSRKRDIFTLIINGIILYFLLSWDLIFGDVFALAPGFMLTLIYLLEKKGYMIMILSTFYALLWTLFYPTFLWIAPVIFVFFSLLSIFYNRKRKSIKGWFFLFYFLEVVFCVGFYNQFQIQYTQLIQLGLYLIIFLHIRVYRRLFRFPGIIKK